jgi:hypothetical protein
MQRFALVLAAVFAAGCTSVMITENHAPIEVQIEAAKKAKLPEQLRLRPTGPSPELPPVFEHTPAP